MFRKQVLRTADAAFLVQFFLTSVVAANVPIYGGPTFDTTTNTGLQVLQQDSHVGNGVAVAPMRLLEAGVEKGYRAIRWDAAGNVVELQGLSAGRTNVPLAINNFGVAVGYAAVPDPLANRDAWQAVRWDPFLTTATPLQNLPPDQIDSVARAVSDSNFVVGQTSSSAGRWDAAGNFTLLLAAPFQSNGLPDAVAVNNAGTAVGGYRHDFGRVAARWDGPEAVVTELGNLGTDLFGHGYADAIAINNAGSVVGTSVKFDANHPNGGDRAVRWDPSSTVANELGTLGEDGTGYTISQPAALNDAGTVVGYALKFIGGDDVGTVAVRWDANGAVTELSEIGTDANGRSYSKATDINNAGIAVGFGEILDAQGELDGSRALMWGADGVAIDLTTLIDPASGWVALTGADEITDGNWVSGWGQFDPDGSGPLPAYDRLFLMQVPEPAGAGLVLLASLLVVRVVEKPKREVHRLHRFHRLRTADLKSV